MKFTEAQLEAAIIELLGESIEREPGGVRKNDNGAIFWIKVSV